MKTPEEIKEASSQYADLIKHMDDFHTEACQLDFQAGANWMKDQSTSQIEDLTKEVERLKAEKQRVLDLAKSNIKWHRNRNHELKLENDRYREALEMIKTKLDNHLPHSYSLLGEEIYKVVSSALHPLVKEGE